MHSKTCLIAQMLLVIDFDWSLTFTRERPGMSLVRLHNGGKTSRLAQERNIFQKTVVRVLLSLTDLRAAVKGEMSGLGKSISL